MPADGDGVPSRQRRMARVYVTGHRNPDLDSIGSAIGYAELMGRLHPGDEYVPVRLGKPNAQTQWALERSSAALPAFLEHVHLRVSDVMEPSPLDAHVDDPVRSVGIAMSELRTDMVPVLDEDGALAGVVTERDLARMYIRDSRGATTSTFADRPARLGAIVDVLGGELLAGSPDFEVRGRLWVAAMDLNAMAVTIDAGDIVVVGDREDAQRALVADIGVAVLVVSGGDRPTAEVLALAQERDVSVVSSPLDSYVTARLVQLAVPCRAIMSRDPLTVSPEDLVTEITETVKDVESRAAIALDEEGRPLGLVSRAALVNPEPRHVLLVDHAEAAQSVPGVEQAHIVEILDHHHVGSIETRVPVRATFDPVGSTATLVVERFRAAGREPKGPTATVLLCAILSDTVILSSPTTTDRDGQVVAYLEELLGLDARELGMQMFEASSDVSALSAEEIVGRDAKDYTLSGGRSMSIAQVETVGGGLRERADELLAALAEQREARGHAISALMLTDIVAKDTMLLVAGDAASAARTFGRDAADGVIELPGVMSRKKQVAPRLLGAA
jgi:manganese-dependent inorganic pyrophosphatase